MSPMWNELLLFDQLIIDGKREELKTETPVVIISLFSQSTFVSTATLPSCCHFKDRAEQQCMSAANRHLGATSLFSVTLPDPDVPVAVGPEGYG